MSFKNATCKTMQGWDDHAMYYEVGEQNDMMRWSKTKGQPKLTSHKFRIKE